MYNTTKIYMCLIAKMGCGMRLSKRGFTLTEIMIAITIMAVLAGLAIPGYFRTVEQGRSNEAITNLKIILMGEKIYRRNNASFWDGGGAATAATINAALNVDITAKYYTTFVFSGVGANGFTVRTTRNNVEGGAQTHWEQLAYTTAGGPVETRGGNF